MAGNFWEKFVIRLTNYQIIKTKARR